MSLIKRFERDDRVVQSLTVERSPSRFLNEQIDRFQLNLVVRRELGIVARVALVFSRRGLDIERLTMNPLKGSEQAELAVDFCGSRPQLRAVFADLSKLIDVESIEEVTLPRKHHSGSTSPQTLERTV